MIFRLYQMSIIIFRHVKEILMPQLLPDSYDIQRSERLRLARSNIYILQTQGNDIHGTILLDLKLKRLYVHFYSCVPMYDWKELGKPINFFVHYKNYIQINAWTTTKDSSFFIGITDCIPQEESIDRVIDIAEPVQVFIDQMLDPNYQNHQSDIFLDVKLVNINMLPEFDYEEYRK